MPTRNLVVLVVISFILAVSIGVIAVARGYRPDLRTGTIIPTGILVATSDPDGAEVFIDNKLTTATNTTLNLSPGTYRIRIAKDGFFDWEKVVTIKKEEVYKTNAFLFPRAADLRPLTFSGALSPTLSPDGSEIAYAVASASANTNGIWILSMNLRPIIGGSDFRQIYKDVQALSLSGSIRNFLWSTDQTSLVASTSAGSYFSLETNLINLLPQALGPAQLASQSAQWSVERQTKLTAQLAKLPDKLLTVLTASGSNVSFSPDESKILYTATASATLPTISTEYIPGANPTPQNRSLTPADVYVYDIKEDRNYLVQSPPSPKISALPGPVTWFPTSRHLLFHDHQSIWLTEYDGSNKAVIYQGPFTDDIVFVWPNASKIVISTSLNPISGVGENLYTVNLR